MNKEFTGFMRVELEVVYSSPSLNVDKLIMNRADIARANQKIRINRIFHHGISRRFRM